MNNIFKFFMILVSLLMIVFGFICLLGASDNDGISKIKEKVEYNLRSQEDKVKIDNYIIRFRNRGFITFILGFCLFIASLFLK